MPWTLRRPDEVPEWEIIFWSTFINTDVSYLVLNHLANISKMPGFSFTIFVFVCAGGHHGSSPASCPGRISVALPQSEEVFLS